MKSPKLHKRFVENQRPCLASEFPTKSNLSCILNLSDPRTAIADFAYKVRGPKERFCEGRQNNFAFIKVPSQIIRRTLFIDLRIFKYKWIGIHVIEDIFS